MLTILVVLGSVLGALVFLWCHVLTKLPIVVFWGSVFGALLGDIDPLSTGSPEFSGASFLVFFYMLLPAGSFPSEWVPEVLGI